MKAIKHILNMTKRLEKMQKEPAGKEWFAKYGMPKSMHHPAHKAITDYEKRVLHKAIGGTLHFAHPKSKQSMKHAEHLKTMEARKDAFRAATVGRYTGFHDHVKDPHSQFKSYGEWEKAKNAKYGSLGKK